MSIKLEVGKKYLDENGEEAIVTAIGKDRLLYEEAESESEYSVSVKYVQNHWKELPKEPKKLGRLMFSRASGDVCVSGSRSLNPNFWQPVTINEKGEVFEVEGE